MKKITCIVGIFIVFSMNLHAQNTETKEYRNQLQFSPFYFLAKTFYVSYERMLPNVNGAIRISPSVMMDMSKSYYDLYDDMYVYNIAYSSSKEAYALELAYKMFTFESPRTANIYFSPYTQYKYIIEKYNDNTHKNNVFGAGIDAGIKLSGGRFVMDITCGGGVRVPFNEDKNFSSEMFDDNYKGIIARANFLLGMTF
ncbi:MAG: hypothetical protein FWC39_04285 [Bacteroidetes bacterium]|nr:hypothetical protein [Bacteroidota bacterium]